MTTINTIEELASSLACKKCECSFASDCMKIKDGKVDYTNANNPTCKIRQESKAQKEAAKR